jgi:ribosomal protein L31
LFLDDHWHFKVHLRCDSQDTTSNPRYTGEKKGIMEEEGRAAQFMRKFDFGRSVGAKKDTDQ